MTRIVLLPGANGRGAGFARAGFHDAVREQELAIGLDCCDLEFEHLTDRTMLRRLRDGPVATARYPHELGALCLIAPYLGSRIRTDEISRAGGVAAWNLVLDKWPVPGCAR